MNKRSIQASISLPAYCVSYSGPIYESLTGESGVTRKVVFAGSPQEAVDLVCGAVKLMQGYMPLLVREMARGWEIDESWKVINGPEPKVTKRTYQVRYWYDDVDSYNLDEAAEGYYIVDATSPQEAVDMTTADRGKLLGFEVSNVLEIAVGWCVRGGKVVSK